MIAHRRAVMTAPEPTAAAAATRDQMPALEVRGLTVSYHEKPVLQNVSVTIPPGDLVAIVGPNGAGKSTLLKAILGLVRRDSGEVRIFGQSIDSCRLNVAYVPQTESVDWDFPVTASEVVMMGRYGHLGMFRRPVRRDHEIVGRCLETVSMTGFARRHIRQLSGGQQQRIFLARALSQEAQILLLDEPFAGVDARTEASILDLMTRFSADGKTLVVVTHDLQMLDRFRSVLLLNESVIAFGPSDEVVNPRNLRRTYGGRLSFIEEAQQELAEKPKK